MINHVFVPLCVPPPVCPCRRGYDVVAFALAGAAASVGLDLCPIAVQAAKDEQQLEIGNNPAACAASKLVVGDFFSHDSSADYQGPYDIGYDYTFLCALHPGESGLVCKGWTCPVSGMPSGNSSRGRLSLLLALVMDTRRCMRLSLVSWWCACRDVGSSSSAQQHPQFIILPTDVNSCLSWSH